jgi:cytochrome c-type biogenesis protein CcmH
MIAFWMWAASLMAAALALLLPPLLRRAPGTAALGATAPGDAGPVDSARSNVLLLREQLDELDAELARGGIGEAQHRSARAELERRVLDESQGLAGVAAESEVAARHGAAATPARAWKSALALFVILPVGAAGLYGYLGQASAIDQVPAGDPNAKVTPQDIEAMIAKLAQKMKAQPGDPEGWVMLGRSYAALQRFGDASEAYAHAVALRPDDGQLVADYADVLSARDRTTRGAAQVQIDRALQLTPNNPKALALAGGAAFERQDFPAAVRFWTQARAAVPANSEFASLIDNSIAEARAAAASAPAQAAAGAGAGAGMGSAAVAVAGQAVASAAGATGAPAAAGAVAGRVSGRVSLAPALAAQASPGDTVFLFARAAQGPRMPLAVQRRTVAELPFSFTLDDSMAMSPGMALSKFPSVIVSARISKSGQAMPQPGDLIGQAAPVSPGGATVNIVIDQAQP